MINSKKVFAIVMAGGKGTRIGATDKPKAMFEVAGKPIIDWALKPFFELEKEGIVDRIVVIVGFCGDKLIDHLGDKVEFVWQKEQLGTAHAVSQVEQALGNEEGITLIVNGDHPLYTALTYKKMISELVENNLTIGFGVVHTEDRFDDYGRVVRDDSGKVLSITERSDVLDEQIPIAERSLNLYAVDNKWLFKTLPQIDNQNAKQEYYINQIVPIAISENKAVKAVEIEDLDEGLGINTLEQRDEAEAILKRRENS